MRTPTRKETMEKHKIATFTKRPYGTLFYHGMIRLGREKVWETDRGFWDEKDALLAAEKKLLEIKENALAAEEVDDSKYEIEYTDSYKERQGGREF